MIENSAHLGAKQLVELLTLMNYSFSSHSSFALMPHIAHLFVTCAQYC